MTAPVSVVVITKDEQGNIARCLNSVRWAEERIVVDANSEDRTRDIARGLGARVFERAWAGYGPQKNFGLDQATQPWILNVDADEEVTPELAAEIEKRLSGSPAESAFRVYIPTYFMGKVLGHYGRARDEPGHVRLFRKDAGRFDDRRVHEAVQARGRVGWLDCSILHHSYPSVETYWRKIHHYAHLEAEERVLRGRAGNRWFRSAGKLLWMLFWRRGILDGVHATVWICGQAYQEWLTATEANRLLRKSRRRAVA